MKYEFSILPKLSELFPVIISHFFLDDYPASQVFCSSIHERELTLAFHVLYAEPRGKEHNRRYLLRIPQFAMRYGSQSTAP
jgi:hypothetical protein